MLKRVFKSEGKGKGRNKELLASEVSEIAEIAERLYGRLDEKLRSLKAVETRVDGKIEMLEKLLLRVEALNLPSDYGVDPRYREIGALSKKGLKIDEIAGILDVPRGEVELILSVGA